MKATRPSGRWTQADISAWQAFCYWRIAVVAEGIKRRYETGAMAMQTADSAELDRRVRGRADLARHFLDGAVPELVFVF